MSGLGEEFRAAREARGLSLSEVAEQIRIRSVYLAEIEAENWSAIGAPVYVRGFLRTYARFLGLDPEEAVSQFNKSTGTPSVAEGALIAGAEPENRRLSPLIWIASVVALALIGLVIYNYYALRSAPAGVAASSPLPSNSVAPSPSTQPSPSVSLHINPPAAHTLELRLRSASWLRISVDGSVSMEGTFPKGTTKVFHGKNAIVLAGNAGGVELVIDGKLAPKLGGTGEVAQRTFKM